MSLQLLKTYGRLVLSGFKRNKKTGRNNKIQSCHDRDIPFYGGKEII